MPEFNAKGPDDPKKKELEERRQRFLEAQKRKQRLKEKMENVKYKITVMSGKGGVGKSTVSVNLAVALAEEGFNVGLLDLDLHGPNVVRMLGLNDKLSVDSGEILPAYYGTNLKVISMAFLLEEGAPVIWRGPLKTTAIEQFLADVRWGELDFLVVDLPPGTGDEALTLYQSTSIDGAVLVTTPQVVALDDVRRAAKFVLDMRDAPMSASKNVKILGVIENMAYLRCPNGDIVYLFGKGGGERLAQELEVPLLAKIPMDPKAMEMMDKGMPPVSFYRSTEFEQAFRKLVGKILEELKGES